MLKRLPTVFVGCLMLGLGLLVFGQSAPLRPSTPPATAPAAGEAAIIAPAASPLLDGIRDAYGKLKNLDLTGEISIDLDAAGEKGNQKSTFTSSFQSPDKFRHDMKDDLLIVSNGEKAFVYKPDKKKYATVDPITEKQNLVDLPPPLGEALLQQNPSLLLALVKDAAAALAEDVKTIDVAEDTKINDQVTNVLVLKSGSGEMRAFIDPTTKLLRRVTIDMREQLKARAVPQVNTFLVTIDYTKTSIDAGAVADAGRFNWTPPSDAILVKIQPDAAGGSGGSEAALALIGKPAPDFTLKDLAGKDVTLASLKGNVVVLDFWATWCGPCRASMPHLNTLYKDLSGRGLKLYAVDESETKAAVEQYLTAEKLTLPVLMDETSKVGELYKVTGIPQTVVIGKDGVIRKVIIGYGPGGEDDLRKEVEAAMRG